MPITTENYGFYSVSLLQYPIIMKEFIDKDRHHESEQIWVLYKEQ